MILLVCIYIDSKQSVNKRPTVGRPILVEFLLVKKIGRQIYREAVLQYFFNFTML